MSVNVEYEENERPIRKIVAQSLPNQHKIVASFNGVAPGGRTMHLRMTCDRNGDNHNHQTLSMALTPEDAEGFADALCAFARQKMERS